MDSEQQLGEEREQLIEAMGWIDKKRQALKRRSFSESRKSRNRTRNIEITFMKKESEWLFGQRTRICNRLGEVGAQIKQLRAARNGKPDETFATTFFKVARKELDTETFEGILDKAERQCPAEGSPYVGRDGEDATVLETLKDELESFQSSNKRSPSRNSVHQEDRPPEREWIPRERVRDSQEDFGLDKLDFPPSRMG